MGSRKVPCPKSLLMRWNPSTACGWIRVQWCAATGRTSVVHASSAARRKCNATLRARSSRRIRAILLALVPPLQAPTRITMTAISLPSVQQLTHLFPYRYSSSNVDRWVVSPTGAGSDHPHHALASHLPAARRPCESEEARCRARALLLDGGPAPAAASRHHAGVREPFAGVLPLLHPLRDAGRADGSPADAGDRVCAAQRAGPRLRAAMVPGRTGGSGFPGDGG